MKKTFLSRIPASLFPSLFPTMEDLRLYFEDNEVLRARHVAGKARQKIDDKATKSNRTKNHEQLVYWQGRVPWLRAGVKAAEGHEDHEGLMHDLYLAERELKKYEERVQNESATRFVEDVLEYTMHEEIIESLDALADEIGAWFSTGALGKGAVTYNGKTYTAE